MWPECADSKGARGSDTGTYTGHSEMHGKVFDTRSAVHSDQNDESDGSNTHATDDERCANASSVGKHCDTETRQEAQEVGRDDQLEDKYDELGARLWKHMRLTKFATADLAKPRSRMMVGENKDML